MNDRDKLRSGGKQHIYEESFDYTLPRPPALGEEREPIREKGPPPMHQMDRIKHPYKSSSPLPKPYYEEDGKLGSRPSSSHEKTAPPDCFSWHYSLHNLLQDPEGVKLFMRYLKSDVPQHAEALDFWFACEGLKKDNDAEKIRKIVNLIYKKYVIKPALPIRDELRRQITKNRKSPQCLDPPVALFDEAQAYIENLINETTYPNFLKSDLYLQYLQSVQNISSGSDDVCSESSSSSSSVSNKEIGNLASGPGLLPTVLEDQEFSTTPLPHFPLTPGTGNVSTGYHTPTVRLTHDLLLRSQKHRDLWRPKTEAYAGEGKGRSRHKNSLEAKQARESASQNKETDMHQAFIPRTHRIDTTFNITKCHPIDLYHHAAILREKLERVKREQETQDLLDRKLKESDSLSSIDDKPPPDPQFQDDNDQDILDEHVSRVFSDHSLSVSPGLASPKPSSPSRSRWRSRRKEKDVFSTFSGDSGNVHDFSDEYKSGSMTKSKSIPEYSEERFSRTASCRKSASSKKTLTDLTDSGVSVVSDTASVGLVPQRKDSKVLTWLLESNRSGGRIAGGQGHAYSEMAFRERKYGKRYGSRSNSLERNSGTEPAQPFIADPSMPPPPRPNTDIQLEEIRRRLVEDDVSRMKLKQKLVTQSGHSTLRKSTKMQRPFLPADDVTTVVCSYSEEEYPYRTKITGSQITLRQFKDNLPKKGNYRYFFKTVCEDLNNQVTNQEVINDNEIVPLWEGNIIAQVKPID